MSVNRAARRKHKVDSRRLRSLKACGKENGTAHLLLRMLVATRRRCRDRFIGKQIGCSPLCLGRNPRILGRKHLSIGSNFAAGDCLWLEAVTEYQGTFYDSRIMIGSNVRVSDFVHIAATNRVTIGDGTLIGSRVLVTDHNHGDYDGLAQTDPEEPPSFRKLSSNRTVTIGRNVWIGDGVAILGGADIGDGSVIGANSVVAGFIPSNCIAAGTPARPIRYYLKNDKAWLRGEA